MQDLHRLDGRKTLVTGAASGIGAATARLFRALGAEVIGLDRNPCQDAHRHVTLDLSDPASIDAAVAQAGAGIDILCNIAGISGKAPPLQVMEVNFIGARHLTEAVLPRMSRGGSIVNLGSGAGANWRAHLPKIIEFLSIAEDASARRWLEGYLQSGPDAYGFSKEVLIAWTALRGGPTRREMNVRINAVSPGPVETPLLGEFKETMGVERVNQVIADGGQAGRPEDIASVVAFLASPAASWVCGENIAADGGVLGARAMRTAMAATE